MNSKAEAVKLDSYVPAAKKNFGLPLAILLIGTFTAILNNSTINVALPELMKIFNTTPDKIQWVLTGFMLTSGVVIPVSGYLGDNFGLKRIYMIFFGIFILGSVFCSLAWDVNSLIASRIIQAIGTGVMMPISMAYIYKLVPRNKIGTALGYWGVASMSAPAIGPTLGGFLMEQFGWRVIFAINIPLGIIGLVLTMALVPEIAKIKGEKFDFRGFVFSSLGSFSLLFALSAGNEKGWTSPLIIFFLLLGIGGLITFVLIELRQPQPMLDVRIFNNKIFAFSALAVCSIAVGLFSGVFLIPMFTQNVLGYSPLETGLLLMPSAIVMACIMPLSGKLFDRFGARPLGLFGLSLLAYTTYLLHNFDLDTSYAYMQTVLIARNIGIGFCNMPIATAGMNTIPNLLVARASAMQNVVRQIFASMGVAVMAFVLHNRTTYYQGFFTKNPQALEPIGGLEQGSMGFQELLQLQATVKGMEDTFVLLAILIVLTMPTVLILSKDKVEKERIKQLAIFREKKENV